MSKKDEFIKYVESCAEIKEMDEGVKAYFEAFKGGEAKEKPAFTENGKLVLDFMQKNKESFNNLFKAKEIGEGMGITSRTASGAMRKLVVDGYVERLGENPVIYGLTEKGTSATLDEE